MKNFIENDEELANAMVDSDNEEDIRAVEKVEDKERLKR